MGVGVGYALAWMFLSARSDQNKRGPAPAQARRGHAPHPPQPRGTPSPSARPPAASTAAPSTAPAQGALIDINSASKDELLTLNGISTATADAILRGRPYVGKDELHRKNIIPQSVYEEIKDRIVARQS